MQRPAKTSLDATHGQRESAGTSGPHSSNWGAWIQTPCELICCAAERWWKLGTTASQSTASQLHSWSSTPPYRDCRGPDTVTICGRVMFTRPTACESETPLKSTPCAEPASHRPSHLWFHVADVRARHLTPSSRVCCVDLNQKRVISSICFLLNPSLLQSGPTCTNYGKDTQQRKRTKAAAVSWPGRHAERMVAQA